MEPKHILGHMLVPEYKIISKEEEQEVLTTFKLASRLLLPKALASEPAVKALGAKEGDVLKIIRKGESETPYYRLVVK